MHSEMESYFDRLWPLHRSITGGGLRETLKILSEIIPLEIQEVPTGLQVYDWTVPREWVVHEAYLEGPNGETILDVNDHNLHLLNYSNPFHGTVSKSELDDHLFSLPDKPKAIPYVTSYYDDRWGFCISHETRRNLPEGEYKVVIKTELTDGSMTLGEAVIEGETDEEILFSTYTCHPSMANNELSGPLVTAFLYRELARRGGLRFTYRFSFAPETIGCLAFLSKRGDMLINKLQAGYNLTCVGDPGHLTYKKSRRGEALCDKAALTGLLEREHYEVREFSPLSSNERQFCSPGFNLPVGTLMRTPPGEFAEYHTSLDDRDFVSFEAMVDSVKFCEYLVDILESNRTFVNNKPFGEPKLDKYGLHETTGGQGENLERRRAIKWVLNLSDGNHDLIDISQRSGFRFNRIREAVELCRSAGLLTLKDEYLWMR